MNPPSYLRPVTAPSYPLENEAGPSVVIQRAREAIEEQAEAIRSVARRLDDRFARAVRLLLRTPGHVVVAGLGKSGHVGRKISATLASTGTPSFFLHATEALHGDLGKITDSDTLILLSYSGETAEVLELLMHARMRSIPTIAIVGRTHSTLANGVEVALDASVPRETCPNDLAPTSSTLATLAVGDALAVCLMHERSFRAEDFAKLHPAGQLGKRLRMRAHQCMQTQDLPRVASDTNLSRCMVAATRGRSGLAVVVDERGAPVGVLGEDELTPPSREVDCARWLSEPASARMRRDFVVVESAAPMAEVESRLAAAHVSTALVVDAHGVLIGLVDQRR